MLLQDLKYYVESKREELGILLSDLIGIKSLTGYEGGIVSRVKREMELMGFDEVFTDSIGNVIGRIGNGSKVIVYDAHLDVVPADEKKWDTNPFEAVIKGDKVYGRGAVDDKGPFTSILFAGLTVKNLELASDFTVYIVGSISEEECEGLALGSFLEEYDVKPDYVVVAEASDLKICRGHRGRALIEVSFEGQPVHASIHNEGINPIETALPFLSALIELDKNLVGDSDLGKGSVVATGIESIGASASTTPSLCNITIDRRLSLKDSRESILNELITLPNGEKAGIRFSEYREKSYNGYMKQSDEYFPAWVLPEEHSLIQGGINTYKSLFNSDPEVSVWKFSTNGNYTMGKKNIPTIGFGPGKENYAHMANECISVNDMIRAVQFYAWLPTVL